MFMEELFLIAKNKTKHMCVHTNSKQKTNEQAKKKKATGSNSNVCFSLSLIFSFSISCLDFQFFSSLKLTALYHAVLI